MIDKDKISFAFPGLVLRADLVASFDLSSNLAVIGHPVNGIIGYDLMEQYVTEIDYDAQLLRLFDPKTFTYQGTGEALRLIFENRVPHVVVNIEVPGQPAEDRTLLVDSGSQDGVDDALIARSAQVREVLSGVGNGKEFRGVHGRVASFKIGKYEFKDFVGGGSGVPLIGGDILRRFSVIFDFSRARMYLEPNRSFSEPVTEDRSGLVLRLAPAQAGMLVHDVAKDSPASKAGLQRDDLVTAIDGCPANAFRLDRVQRLLQQDHKSHTFTVRRNGRDISATLTTQSVFASNSR
jgi:PDZ domain